MPDEEIEQVGENGEQPEPNEAPAGEPAARSGGFFTRRNAVIALGAAGVLAVLIALFTVVGYRTGLFDTYIKAQFTARMAEMNLVFDADVFRVTVAPLRLELRNATFNDRISGEKLFFIREATLGLTVKDLYAWQLSRDISIDTTDVTGAEVWVTFDEQGRSNFANIQLVEEEEGARVRFKYQSLRFALRESVVHFADRSRSIEADANNLVFLLEPEDLSVPDEQKRYRFDLTATDSRFLYEGRPLEDIDVRAVGIADRMGAEISDLTVRTPAGHTSLNGTITDWAEFRYDLNVESTVDLTQTSAIFPLGAAVRGVGNFRGRVSGQGEQYRVEGNIDSDALAAEGIYLRAVNVNATVEGRNSMYEANGNAVAELLTFGDFRIEFPRMAGNVRGTGTDFRWVGELQAAAARSGSMTLGGLFLADAVAEYRDRLLSASAGSATAQRFSMDDTEMTGIRATGLRYSDAGGSDRITANSLQAASLRSGSNRINNVSAGQLRATHTDGRTIAELDRVAAGNADLGDARLSDVSARDLRLLQGPSGTRLTARDLRAGRLTANGTVITGINAPSIDLTDSGAETVVHSDTLRVASVQAGGATLGSLNIAGVRLTIRQGRVEARSDDIDAGSVALARSSALPEGGTLEAVRIERPVFILEPSGRYRVTADMSLGGGTIGSIPLGAARAGVEAGSDRVELRDITASVMEGQLAGNASIALSSRGRSSINAVFSDLDLGKVTALQAGRVIPLEGRTNGRIDISFAGTDYRTTTGTINADITATAGSADRGTVPVNGRIGLSAVNGLFNVEEARLNTPNSVLNASGRFDLRTEDSDLAVAVSSTDASEIDRLIRVTGLAPEVERQLDSMQASVAGALEFSGTITGNLTDPVIDGRASVGSVRMRGRELGALSAELFVSPTAGTQIRNGRLREPDGGTADFALTIPNTGSNNISVKATLTNIDAGNLIAALPVDDLLPAGLRDFSAQTSGTVNITGLPNEASGSIDIASAQGTVAGQSFDALRAQATFEGTRIIVDQLELRSADGFVRATGNYDRATSAFNFDLRGQNVELAGLRPLLGQSESIPAITGTADITATATGEFDRPSTFNVNFEGTARNVVINENAFGEVKFRGNTADQVLNADLTATLDGTPQLVRATVNFADPDLPFRVEHELNQSPLRPFLALIPQLQGISLGGTGTGRVEFGGNLSRLNADGTRSFTAEGLTGSAQFSQLALQIQDSPLVATQPVVIRFNTSEVVFESAQFSGGGTNIVIEGTKAITDDGINNLAVNGRVNLGLLNAFPAIASGDTFFTGFADVAIRLAGVNRTARLSGTADLANAAVATFIGSGRITLSRLEGRILFTTDQIQSDRITGFLGGGRFTASGGASMGEGLEISQFRVTLNGTNVTVPIPEDFTTTGDVKLEITGTRGAGGVLGTLVSGSILARRSLYTQDIDLANIVGARREGSLSSGPSSMRAPRLDLSIEGRNALVIRNNIADLTASVSLRLTGTSADPQVSGRITANSGTVFFRNDRYIVQRGVLDFPPNTEIEPIINLQAETEIAGYQVFVNLSGPLTDTEMLSATVRSSPALPQADVVSLITTGSLSNTETGLPSLAQTGINTAADILTDTIISNPARKATDKLFGLNVFELDPIISGDLVDPSARLTVGRQINNNLRVTYATNLSQDQNQVVALEYRVSNKLSVVAQYEQRPLSNVTRNRNNFSIEVRFRKRF
jgi:translocation and assembly module TamB